MSYYAAVVALTHRFQLARRRQVADLFMAKMCPAPDATLLDVGGPGLESALLAARGLRVTATNVDLRDLHQPISVTDGVVQVGPYQVTCHPKEGQWAPHNSGEVIERIPADAREMPFADKSFDYALCTNVLEHVEPSDRPRVRDELQRVTRRGFMLTTPNYWFPIEPHTMIPLFQYWLSITRSDISNASNALLMRPKELKRLFSDAKHMSLGFAPLVPETLVVWRTNSSAAMSDDE